MRFICSAALLFWVPPHQTVSKINCTFMYPLQSCSVILPNRQMTEKPALGWRDKFILRIINKVNIFQCTKFRWRDNSHRQHVSILPDSCLTASMRSNEMDTKYIIQRTKYTTGGIYVYPKHVTHWSKSSYLKQTQLPYSAWPFQTQYKLIH